ncbi:hypothetical protein Vretifemale_9901 [Volvox reticuliferus]|uniref:Uncharacterized protein n=1 Tax=Volvox reticuliferus TaxID=1737510 RepID=A0A8J4CIN6_9CHLO|nr:hypothetical protein Vretifemale_9901 [Volvox reticuliferus]
MTSQPAWPLPSTSIHACQTLDDYRAFVQRTSPAYRTDYMDDGYGYSDYYDMTHGSEDEDNGDNTVPDAPSRRLAPPSLSHTARLAKPDSLRREAPADETPIDRTTASSLPAVAPWPTPAAGTSPTPVAAMAAKRSGSGSGVDGTGTHPLAAAAAQVFPAASSIAPAAAQAPLSQGASSSPTGYLQAQSQPRVQPDMIPPHQGLRTAGSEIEQREEEDDTSGIHPIFVGENRLIDDNNGDAAAVARRQKEGAGLLGLLRARTDDALLPPHLQRLLGRSNPKGGGQRQPLLLLGRPTVAAAASRALTAPEVVAATQRLANTAAQQAVHAAQLVSEGAALRTEAVLRVIVRLVNAGSPFTAFMMNASKAWYDGAARLSNAAVDAAIRRLEEGVPPALADELRRRADDMAVRLSAALQDGLQEGMAPGWGDGSGGR